MKKIKHISYTYVVRDNYGNDIELPTLRDAEVVEEIIKEERKVLDLIKPTGVTLILSKLTDYYPGYVIPAFIGWNGVPFCECNKDKDRDFFHNLNNTIENTSSIHGNLLNTLKSAYKLLDLKGRNSYDYWSGAYHYHWDIAYGNENVVEHYIAWCKGALWYHWNGKTFTTNDPKCKLTSKDF